MGRFRTFLLVPISLFFLPVIARATVQQTPAIDAVINYSGPLVIFWDTQNPPVDIGANYYIFVSTVSLLTGTTAALLADPLVDRKLVNVNEFNRARSMYDALDTFFGAPLTNGQTYNIRMVAEHNGDWSGLSNRVSRTSYTKQLKVREILTSVGGVSGTALLQDTSSMSITCVLEGEGGTPFLGYPALGVRLDIKTNTNPTSIFVGGSEPTLGVDVQVSSTNFRATVSTYTWYGEVYNDKEHKHVGYYRISATPLDSGGGEIAAGKAEKVVVVDVPHINIGRGIVYTTVGSNEPHYGPPFTFDYYLSVSAFVTVRIWDDPSLTQAVKTVVSGVPRPGSDENDSPEGRDKLVHREVWDGRNEQGFIVANGIYYYTIQMIDDFGRTAITYAGDIAYDVLRLVDIGSTGITDTTPLAQIKYTLAGANSQMGGATIKIAICTPGTTFYMASTSGSITYLNGAATYNYVPGDPLPTDASRLRKVFVFARTAGVHAETWNGADETGAGLSNDNYVFAISATDDSGNHAIDNSGNDRILIGNITIDRTAAQKAVDSTPPTVSAVSVRGTPISFFGSTILELPFDTLSITLADTGGSGVDFTGTMVTLTGPTTNYITMSVSNDNSQTITATFAQQLTNGTYTLRIRPKDKIGNTASDVVVSFTLAVNPNAIAPDFYESLFVYPNPAKGAASVNFSYYTGNASAMKLEIYNILGELMYEERWTSLPVGQQTKSWSLVNRSQNKLATGVYLYRIVDENSANKTKKLKKLIIIQ